MTKLPLSEDIYSRKSLKGSSSYENNQVRIDGCSVFRLSIDCDTAKLWTFVLFEFEFEAK